MEVQYVNSEEIWKGVKDFEGCYLVSNMGRVKSLARMAKRDRSDFKVKEKILHGTLSMGRYLKVNLGGCGLKRLVAIHVLVAEAFLNHVSKRGIHIDHINGDGTDNRVVNLRICTAAENTRNCKNSKNNTTGYKGVRKSPTKFTAQIMLDRKPIYIGSFDDAITAAKAYDNKEVDFYAEIENKE